MNRSNKFRKKVRSNDGKWNLPSDYYFEKAEYEKSFVHCGKTLYDVVDRQEWLRVFGGQSSLTPEELLKALQEEIKFRIKITKNEVFKIGELLINAKNICQQEGLKFKEWISEKFDFSYETANNFMNVYKNCLGLRNVVLNLSPSILYQISSPSFPEELKKHLFDTEQINEITNGRLREITKKYKKGGFDAIKDDIAELNRGHVILQQSCYTLDVVENALRTMEALHEKIERRGRSYHSFLPFENQIKTDEPESFEVNSKLVGAVQSAIDLLEKARHESEQILLKMQRNLYEKCGMVESDGRIEKKEKAKFDAKHGEK